MLELIRKIKRAVEPQEILVLCNKWNEFRDIFLLVARHSKVFDSQILDRIHTYGSIGLDIAANPFSNRLCARHLLRLVRENQNKESGVSLRNLLPILLLYAWRNNLHMAEEHALELLSTAQGEAEEGGVRDREAAYALSEGLRAVASGNQESSPGFLDAVKPHLKRSLRFTTRPLGRSEYVSTEELRRFWACVVDGREETKVSIRPGGLWGDFCLLEREEAFVGLLEGIEDKGTTYNECMADFLRENTQTSFWAMAALLYSPREKDFIHAMQVFEQELPIHALSKLLQGDWAVSSKLEALPTDMRARLLAKVDSGARLHIIRKLGETR